MEVEPPNGEALEAAIVGATRQAVSSLFTNHPGQYYYLVLVTTGEAPYPFLSAWSEEALAESIARASDPASAEVNLRWSYADSPFCCYGLEHFEPVKALFTLRPRMDPLGPAEGWHEEYRVRVDAMAASLAALDAEGLFGTSRERHRIFINVEVVPPHDTNVDYPEGQSCPHCPYWAGRDRFSGVQAQ